MLDVMHMEQNMFDNLMKYLYGERDIVEVWKDMEEIGVQQHLWLRRKPGATNFLEPTTPFVFTQDENKSFLNFWQAFMLQQHIQLHLMKVQKKT